MARLACMVVPLFPLAARLRCEPELQEEALAILAGNGAAARVVAANRRARRAGLKPGMSLPQARALLPKLKARAPDPVCESAAQEALLEVAERFSPRVEDAGDGTVFLELGDRNTLERRYPGPDPELEFARALLLAADRAELPARAGIAATKLAAKVAAGLPNGPIVVAAGDEARFLAPLPLPRLTADTESAEIVQVLSTLQAWGIKLVGDLAALPRDEVSSRLGRAGQRLHAIARGIDPQPLLPRQLPLDFTEGMDLEWPLVALEPFLFVGHAALDRLCRRLAASGLGCARLQFALRLEPDGCIERAIALPAPTRDAKTLLTLVRLDLEARPPGAAVAGFTFTAHVDAPRAAQLTLLGPAEMSPDRLATTLARLFALLGPDRVGAPRLVDGHRPERAALVPYAPPKPPREHPPARQGKGLLAVRTLRPPLPLEVLVAAAATTPGAVDDGYGVPTEIRCPPPSGDSKSRLAIAGRVRVASGPWRLEESWWTESPAERDYWDIELDGSGVYRVFREAKTGEWFADGVYD
jgi:protein ImuB